MKEGHKGRWVGGRGEEGEGRMMIMTTTMIMTGKEEEEE